MNLSIFKNGTKIVEGEGARVELDNLNPNTQIPEGEYQVAWVQGDFVSDMTPLEAFRTLLIVPSGVTLNKTSTSIVIGSAETLTATVAPSNATNKAVTYSSSNPDVATVTNSGVVTAVSAGTATITCTTTSGNRTATCAVTVTDPVVNVTGVTLSPKTSSAEAGTAGSRQLSATIAPTNATNKNVGYAIAPNATGLAVSSSGNITWTADTPPGVYTTTVTTANGNRTDTNVLTLTAPEPPE